MRFSITATSEVSAMVGLRVYSRHIEQRGAYYVVEPSGTEYHIHWWPTKSGVGMRVDLLPKGSI